MNCFICPYFGFDCEGKSVRCPMDEDQCGFENWEIDIKENANESY